MKEIKVIKTTDRHETERQEHVWNKISKPWKTFRQKPIKEVIGFLNKKKGRILDLGCGSGRNFAHIKNNGKAKGKIYAVDFSSSMLKYAKQYAREQGFNIETIKAYAYELPFRNNFFDSAIFIATLHCIPGAKKRKKALQELRRTLKVGAEAMITVWDKNQPRFKNSKKESFLPWRHEGRDYMRYYYLYQRNEFHRLLKSAGFSIVSLSEKTAAKGLYSSRNIVAVVRK